MTSAHIKEQLSLHYLGSIISNSGYRLTIPTYDYGIDLLISQVKEVNFTGSIRYIELGRVVDVQLKCTTFQSRLKTVEKENQSFIQYDLRAKNYNDLILRKKQGLKPLIFVLVVLKGKPQEWVTITESIDKTEFGLKINGLAYWYFPEEDAFASNSQTKRIFIPVENVIKLNFCNSIFEKFYHEKY